MKTIIEKIKQELAELEENAGKFIDKGNKAAGTRVRTGAMAMIKDLKSLRDKVQETKESK